MIKCLDDGKGNLDSKYILRGSFLSVSNDRLSFSFVQQFLSIINEEIANSMHHSSIVHTIFVERSAIKMYGHSLTLCGLNVNVISYKVTLHFIYLSLYQLITSLF